MDTTHTGQDNAAEIANLFAYLDAPRLRIVPTPVPANDVTASPAAAAPVNVVRYEELKTRARVKFGRNYPGRVEPGFKAEIVPGVSVRIFGTDYKGRFDLTFKLGDVAVYDSFNMVYTAKIKSIGPKTITVGSRRLDICTFAQKNHDYNAERIAKRNGEWMD